MAAKGTEATRNLAFKHSDSFCCPGSACRGPVWWPGALSLELILPWLISEGKLSCLVESRAKVRNWTLI